VAQAQPAVGAPERQLSARAAVAAQAARLLDASADPDGRGLQLRGSEPHPVRRSEFDPLVLDGLLRLARLADGLGHTLREHPDQEVRRSAAILAARAHPLLAAFDG
jgi:hypothetical protein